MRTAIVVLLVLAGAAGTLQAQIIPPPCVEVRPWVGARIPTGPQRELFGAAPAYGLQAGVEMTPWLHILGSFGWSPVRTKLGVGDPGADVFHYDVGTEYNLGLDLENGWLLKPFAGLGAGGRTYRYDDDALPPSSPMAAYASLGAEVERGRSSLRFESRGYLHGYSDPRTEEWDARNEVGVSLGYAYHFRRR